MLINELTEGLGFRVLHAGAAGDVRVCDLTEDSRTVMPGSMFIAKRGAKADGRQFVRQAAEAGAVAVLTDDPELRVQGSQAPIALYTPDINHASALLGERFFGLPSKRIPIIGVTGTNGKTTITYLIHQMLNALGVRTGLIGTVVIDDGVEVAPASMTTPPALEISRTLSRMIDAGCKAAVMEVSSHALDQRRVGALTFRAGVFTNLTGDHLDYHKTMESYADAKAMLFAMLPPDAAAVMNIGDSSHSRMLRDNRARVLRCRLEGAGVLPITGGTAADTVVTARVVGAGASHTDVELRGALGFHRFRLPLIGDFNVLNALQALVAVMDVFGAKKQGAEATGFSIEQVLQALEGASAPPGRVEPVTGDGAPLTVLVDYAHTDDALRTVLVSVRESMRRAGSAGQLWCVFGCGGDKDRTKRPRMGGAASTLADRVIVTSDNPRTEEPMAIIREVQTGIARADAPKVVIEQDRERAIRLAIQSAAVGDTIVIAGKGHEDYQILADPTVPGGTIRRHFDDREIAGDALRARGVQPRAIPVALAVVVDEEVASITTIASSILRSGTDQ